MTPHFNFHHHGGGHTYRRHRHGMYMYMYIHTKTADGQGGIQYDMCMYMYMLMYKGERDMNIYRFTLLERIEWDAEAAALIRADRMKKETPISPVEMLKAQYQYRRTRTSGCNRTGVPADMLKNLSMEELFQLMRA